MATCLQSLQSGATIPELFPGTITPIAFNILQNQMFYIRSSTVQTAKFSFNVTPVNAVTTVNITISAFKKNGNTYTDLGAAGFSDLIGNFSKDFDIGEFYICIRSNQSFTGTIVAQFSGFQVETRLSFDFYNGSTLTTDMREPRPPNPCDEPLFFDLLDGSLPPGINMNGLGRLQGILPNLDCLPDAKNFSPSQNWSFRDESGYSHPWGRTWRFKVRVQLQDMADSYAERWFCIRVHNNWDFDRDNFLRQLPFEQVRELEIIEEPKPLGPVCFEPCPEDFSQEPFVPQPLANPCPSCDESDMVTDIQLIQIPAALSNYQASELPAWWIANKDKEFDCPKLKAFIENLKTSAYFQSSLVQAGYVESTGPGVSLIELSNFQNFLQITASTLVDGRNADDLDTLMLEWKLAQNQKLPIQTIGYNGTKMEVTLK